MKIIEAQKVPLKGSKRKKVKATDLIPRSRNNNNIKKTGKGNTFFFIYGILGTLCLININRKKAIHAFFSHIDFFANLPLIVHI